MTTNRSLFLGVVIALVIVLIAFMAFRSAQAPQTTQQTGTSTPVNVGSTSVQTASSTTVGDVTITGPGNIEIVSDTYAASVPPPSLTGPIVFGASVSTETKQTLTSKQNELITQLKTAPTRVDLWLKLGMYRKQAGDYSGAAVAWNYVAATAPTDLRTTAYANLADMYMNFSEDYAKAEASYKQAIALNPKYVQYYHDLYNLYHLILKDDGKAAAILVQGLKATNNDPELVAVQAQFTSGN